MLKLKLAFSASHSICGTNMLLQQFLLIGMDLLQYFSLSAKMDGFLKYSVMGKTSFIQKYSMIQHLLHKIY